MSESIKNIPWNNNQYQILLDLKKKIKSEEIEKEKNNKDEKLK